MTNLTAGVDMDCNDTDRLMPLDESNYGSYFNSSFSFYDTNPEWQNKWQNMSELDRAGMMCNVCKTNAAELEFSEVQLIRVVITWTLFFISAVGNIFVLCCVCRKARTSHVHMIMMHFAIADLTFTFLVLPKDAMWNTTMQWIGGDFLCRVCQMGKQIGMYISSFMVVVMALDRCCGILQPMCSNPKQRRRTKYLVGGAWILSVISAIPPAILFSVVVKPFCPRLPAFSQCVDFAVVEKEKLRPYLFYTMAMSFIVPMVLCFVFYSLVICEISNMMRRDRMMRGRRDSAVSIMRARRKTLKMTALVTLSFLLFWGPYYGYGVYSWFHPDHRLPKWASGTLFMLMYVHPAIHPFIYGVLMKDVRDTFRTVMLHIEKVVTCSSSELSCGDGSIACLPPTARTHFTPSNGYSRTTNQEEKDDQVPDMLCRQRSVTGERDRLISAGSELGLGDEQAVFVKPEMNGRTSQVSFKLPADNQTTDCNGTSGFNNNNKESGNGDSRDDDIFTSTNV